MVARLSSIGWCHVDLHPEENALSVPYILIVATNAAVIGPHNRSTGFSSPKSRTP
jgi:hypothetical protein